ncbi:MAG: hypothetical protein ACN4GM_00650 [Gammaproteobacteria bacterium]
MKSSSSVLTSALLANLALFLCVLGYTGQAGAINEDSSIEDMQIKIQQQEQAILVLKERLDGLENSGSDSVSLLTKKNLDMNVFFDFTAHTTNSSGHPFDLGGLEIDMQYDKAQNLAISTALVWSADVPEVAVAVIDYHVSNQNVPVRGDIFTEPGFHLQFGRFDIPFGIDYTFFASIDRPNVSAPLTTDRIQEGGFNGDGVRTYGSWSIVDYAFYWTNSLFDDAGSSIGARVGLSPARDLYRVHNRDRQDVFVMGLSWLQDMDTDENERNTLYAIDFSWQLGMAKLIYEFTSLDSVDEVILPDNSSAGPADEEGFNVRLLLDFDPASLFLGYGEWDPAFSARLDEEDNSVSYSVSKLKRLTIGGQFLFNEYLQFKLEYIHHLNTETAEPEFEQRRLTFQMVASF